MVRTILSLSLLKRKERTRESTPRNLQNVKIAKFS